MNTGLGLIRKRYELETYVYVLCLLNMHEGNGLLTCQPKQLYIQQGHVSGTSVLAPENLLDSALSIIYSQVQLIIASI